MKYCVILTLLISFNSLTQNELNLKFAPVNLFHPETALIPIAAEYRFKNFGIEYEHGFRVNSFVFNWNAYKRNQRYFRSQVNLRYYFKNEEVKQFFGVNFSYLPYSYTRENNWFIREGVKYIYSTANIDRQQYKYRIFYGVNFDIQNRLNFELIAGIGHKNTLISYKTEDSDLNVSEFERDEIRSPFDRVETRKNIISLLFTARICYRINRQKKK